MDASSSARPAYPLAVTGLGSCLGPADAGPYLKSRKMLKFMGKQDQLALVAATLALRQAAPDPALLAQRTGIYLAVGYIPFEREDVEPLARHSMEEGRFSMERFSTSGIDQVNPLLTFRCLPNMPIFHLSLNLGIQGPYFITYPGIGQFYQALEQAAWALQEGEVDVALVGGVADQCNFLVDYQCSRLPPTPQPRQDVAAFLCLQRESERPLTRLLSCRLERGSGGQPDDRLAHLGPAGLAWALHEGVGRPLEHQFVTGQGWRGSTVWG